MSTIYYGNTEDEDWVDKPYTILMILKIAEGVITVRDSGELAPTRPSWRISYHKKGSYAYLNPSGSQYFNDGEGYRTYISSRTDIHPEGYVEYRISRPRDPRRATSFIRNAAAQRAAKVTAAIELELERLSRGREPASPEHRQAADDQSSASRERIAELELGGNTGSVPVSCVGSIRPSSEDDDSASEERFELLDGADAATSSGATETESEVVRQVTGIDDDIGLVLPLAQAAEAQDGSANANANNAGADARVRELESEVDVLRRRLEEVELQLARATSPRPPAHL